MELTRCPDCKVKTWQSANGVVYCERCECVVMLMPTEPWWRRKLETLEGRLLLTLLIFGLVAMSC